jgi:hypothetical protein
MAQGIANTQGQGVALVANAIGGYNLVPAGLPTGDKPLVTIAPDHAAATMTSEQAEALYAMRHHDVQPLDIIQAAFALGRRAGQQAACETMNQIRALAELAGDVFNDGGVL